MESPIPKEVNNFMAEISEEVGKMKAEGFHIGVWCKCYHTIKSPIEQMLYCAIRAVEEINWVRELKIEPQKKIDSYRVDFLISSPTKEVIVECDSQQFHERTEQERKYEKRRDRYLLKKGYKAFHYTGSEIMKNSLDIAREIIAYITDRQIDDLFKDSDR